MKRDFELIRALLFHFEEKPDPKMEEKPHIEGYSESEIQYHLRLMYDAGFLNCETSRSKTGDRIIRVYPFDLTWKGHEFLDTIRQDSIWNKIKDYVIQKGQTLSFDAIKTASAVIIKDLLTP